MVYWRIMGDFSDVLLMQPKYTAAEATTTITKVSKVSNMQTKDFLNPIPNLHL